MSSTERVRRHRERKKNGQTGDWQVKALKEEVRILGDLVGSLEARIEVLEGFMRPGMGSPIPCTPNTLAQLRAQIAAVPPLAGHSPQ